MKDIVECTLEMLEIKQRRSESVRNRKWDGFNSFMEVTKRAVKRKKSSRKLQPLSLQAPPTSGLATPTMRRPNRRRSLDFLRKKSVRFVADTDDTSTCSSSASTLVPTPLPSRLTQGTWSFHFRLDNTEDKNWKEVVRT